MERVLVVAAHCDDESFGCLGTLLKHKEAGNQFAFLWYTFSNEERGVAQVRGAGLCATYFDYRYKSFLGFPDQKLDTYSLVHLVTPIEFVVDQWKPTIVYCPFIEDLNKDHRLVSEATMVGCRPYLPNAPKEVWMYSIPGTTELGFRPFKRDKTIKIDRQKKEELIRLWYPNEMINGREKIEDCEHFERWPRRMDDKREEAG